MTFQELYPLIVVRRALRPIQYRCYSRAAWGGRAYVKPISSAPLPHLIVSGARYGTGYTPSFEDATADDWFVVDPPPCSLAGTVFEVKP